MSRTVRLLSAGAVLALSGVLAAGSDVSPARAAHPHDGVSLALVAYSTPKAAYGKIISDFNNTKAGKGISFTQSYGASGDQSRAVAQGLSADIVEFSLEPDITRLVDAGLIDKNWNKGKYRGMVTDSVVVFVVRRGNPKKIHTWNDLLKKGIEVITPNPFQSGSAQWNLMAAYGAMLKSKQTPAQATNYLKKLFDHIAVQDTSGRNATNTWANGKGDVLLSYENEAIAAAQSGVKLDYVVPPQTILIENPAAVIKSSKHVKEARAFLNFLYSNKAQWDFGSQGYRPINTAIFKEFPWRKPKGLFNIGYLGGWSKVEKKFFDPTNGVVAQIERQHGVSP